MNEMKRNVLVIPAMLCLVVVSCKTQRLSSSDNQNPQTPSYPTLDLVQYAKPMCGTGTPPGVQWGDNNTFPGAVAPFGMIQWSPDTDEGKHIAGYGDQDKHISDFSVDHISGAGCAYGGDFAMMPFPGGAPSDPPKKRDAFAQTFSHANEVVKPGYYGVTLDNGLKAELTTTVRSGFGRFIYPGSDSETLMINAGSDINGSAASGININPATREITAWSVGGHFCGTSETRTIYYYAVFDQPFDSWSAWADKTLNQGATNASGTTSGAYITFKTSPDRTVLAKVGISYVSAANAKANIEAESPGSAFTSKGFDRAVDSASQLWNIWLNKIQVTGGTGDELETFYSMLYHALIGPVTVSDANGEYTGYDGKVHSTTDGRVQYGIFSGWDIYRSESQLLALLAPKEAGDMAQSLLVDYQQGGAFPRWGVMTEDSGVMMGDPAAPIIADFYAFGATNFDTAATLKGLVLAATDPSVYAPLTKTYERNGLADYLRLGYIPKNGEQGSYGCVSMVLEFDSADFALSQFAAALGDDSDSATLLKNAQNWRNLYNPDTGYFQMRLRDGSWAPGFKNNVGSYDGDGTVYVEGNAAQYLWLVPFNYKELAEKMGGQDTAVKRLDDFCSKLNTGLDQPYDWMGNEPCVETPWIFDFWGQPWNTQKTVRRAVTELYSSQDAAYPGNDDVGEMSSWYVFSALGMYPELPGSDVLVLGSPLFPKAVLHLSCGDVTITGNGAAKDAPYVQHLTLNGQDWNKPWIRYSDISHGGALVYDLSATADTTWGSDPSDAPPSYSDNK